MVVKTNYDKIDISFHVEKDMVSVLAEHLPAIPVAAWEMYRSIGIGYDFGKDYVSLVRPQNRPELQIEWHVCIYLPCGL